jgi:hypothetical protein
MERTVPRLAFGRRGVFGWTYCVDKDHQARYDDQEYATHEPGRPVPRAAGLPD